MSERWNYQIKTGLLWGLIMIILMALFESQETPIQQQLASSRFYIRGSIYILVGIFLLGYFNWKQKQKNQS